MTGGRAARVVLLAAAVSTAARAAEVPPLTGRVVDGAGILGDAQERLGTVLAGAEARTSAQIAVLTVPTLEGEPIEEFALRTFNTWGLGQKDRNDGVLVLVVPLDRRMRIEVGRGLEEALPQGEAKRIVDEVMAPAFRGGDFAGGVERGVQAVIEQLDGYRSAEGGGAEGVPGSGAVWLRLHLIGAAAGLILLVAAGLAVTGLVLLARAGSRLGSSLWSSGASELVDPGPDEHAWARGPWRSSRRTGSSFDGACSGGGSSRSDWSSSSWRSSSWSSSSWSSSSFSSRSSGSSFSGGGGSSSGSGASGSW